MSEDKANYDPAIETFRNMGKQQQEDYLWKVSENFTQMDAAAMVKMLSGLLEGDKTAPQQIFNLYDRVAKRGN